MYVPNFVEIGNQSMAVYVNGYFLIRPHRVSIQVYHLIFTPVNANIFHLYIRNFVEISHVLVVTLFEHQGAYSHVSELWIQIVHCIITRYLNHIPYARSKFRWNRSRINGTSLEHQVAFWPVSRLLIQIYYRKFTSLIPTIFSMHIPHFFQIG